MKQYTHLSVEDRYTLQKLLERGISMTQVAKQIGYHRSTLYRELSRNHGKTGYYVNQAEQKSQTRRQSRPSKIARNPTLRAYIVQHLKMGWSPEQIVGRLKRKSSKFQVCHETIYRFIYSPHHKPLHPYLFYRKRKRYRRYARKPNQCRFGNKRLISQRPQHIDSRLQWGHWEGDSVEFCGTKKASITTLVERKSRKVFLINNNSKHSTPVMQNIKTKCLALPKNLRRSFTFDQGCEFANHRVLEASAWCRVYYCHTHSPWEKGSNENMNGRLRHFLPKHTNIHLVDQQQLDRIAEVMNNTPRKCLGFRTPNELFSLQLRSLCRTSK